MANRAEERRRARRARDLALISGAFRGNATAAQFVEFKGIWRIEVVQPDGSKYRYEMRLCDIGGRPSD